MSYFRYLLLLATAVVFGGSVHALGAQNTITAAPGASASILVLPSAKLAVPLIVDMSAAGTLDLASLSASVSWNTARLSFDSVTAGVFGTFTADMSNAANGSGSISLTNASGMHATTTIGTLFFTAAGSAGGARISLSPLSAGGQNGADILPSLLTRPLHVCVGANRLWGDTNGDGVVNIVDAQQIARSTVGLVVANSDALLGQGDVTGEGSVNIIDAQQVARFTVGLSTATRVSTTSPGAPVVGNVLVSPSPSTLAIGSTVQLTATAMDAANVDLLDCVPVTFATSDASVATVSANGVVSALAFGNTTISATAGGRTTQFSLAVPSLNTATIAQVGQLLHSPVDITPVNLQSVSGNVLVTVNVSGPPALLKLIVNCTSGGGSSSVGDIVVAQAMTGASTFPSPVILDFNTAATGSVSSGIAIVNASSHTPIALNGSCSLKATAGGAPATNVIQMVLANTNGFGAVATYTKTTPTGAASAVSTAWPTTFHQGDMTITVTPTIFSRGSSGAAQVPANLGISFAGHTSSGVFAGGTLTLNLPSTNFTTVIGEDVLVTSFIDADGATIPVGSSPTTLLYSVAIDNDSPSYNGPLNVSLPNGWINAAFDFSANTTKLQDLAFAPEQLSVDFYVGSSAGGVFPSAQSTNPASAQCSTAGLVHVTSGAALAPSSPGATDRFVRVIESDPLGNVVCQDFGRFGVDTNSPTIAQIAGPGDHATISSGETVQFTYTDSTSGFVNGAEVSWVNTRNFTQCVYSGGTTANGCTTMGGAIRSINNGIALGGYYSVRAQSVDRAGNKSGVISLLYLLDHTLPSVGGTFVPTTLTGGGPAGFLSTANDDVDLKSSHFWITYSAASGAASLYYSANDYGPNFDAARVTAASIDATVPFFIKQLQGTNATGVPIAFVGTDMGRAASITTRAIDAGNLPSSPVTTPIPVASITADAGFTASALGTFAVTNTSTSISNFTGTGARYLDLTASATIVSPTAQTASSPFAKVCFYYLQTGTGSAYDISIPPNVLVSIGCSSAPSVADVPGVSRSFTYTFANFDPPGILGTGVPITVYAIGLSATGVGVISQPNTNISLVP